MQRRRGPVSFAFIGHAIPILAICAIVIVLLLFSRSQTVSDSFDVRGIGSSQLTFQSTEGRLMIGVFESPSRRGWWRPRRASFADLNMSREDYFGLSVDFWGWGICVPHLGVMAALLIPIAWWFMIFRHRDEHIRRIERGLCMNCGYDLSHSKYRCPECGEAHSNIRWNEERHDPSIPLPPPPLS